jgi:hypothetical protein
MTNELNKFLQELINDGSEELYDCVSEKFTEILEAKIGECFRAQTAKRDLSVISRTRLRVIQESN